MNTIKKRFILLLLFITVGAVGHMLGQRFKGGAVAGINLAQIEGDLLAGFNKVGLTAGFKLDYPIRDRLDVGLEMLFSQRGSTDGSGFFGFGMGNNTTLNYVSLPMLITVRDWFINDGDYYKVQAHAGIAVDYLFSVSSINGSYANKLDSFRSMSLGYTVGVGYRFSKLLGIGLRYSRAVTSLLPDFRTIDYYVTIRSEFYF